MGLDQWAYCRPPRKRNSDEDEHLEEWRKHNRLQGYMEQLWESKGCPVPANSYDEDEDEEDEDDWSSGGFNGIELQLTENDIEWLEEAIKNQELPETSDFSSEVIHTHGMKKDMQKMKSKKTTITNKWICSLLKMQKKH